MVVNVRCLTTSVDMMINILHKILSSGMVAAKADTVEVHLEVLAASKGSMDRPIKDMA